jgi:mRNA-degrading endonuclease RelE of RelBE toxin-antitoxin system
LKLRFTEKADNDYEYLPVAVRKAFGQQLQFLLLEKFKALFRLRRE